MVDKIYKMNELVYRAQALQSEVEQWIAANTELDEVDAFELFVDFSNGTADCVEAELLIVGINKLAV